MAIRFRLSIRLPSASVLTTFCITHGPYMPTIVFASPKGGVGKSTAAVLLAAELSSHGDPNRSPSGRTVPENLKN